MNEKHLRARIEQLRVLSTLSNCIRRKMGSMLIDPNRNAILSDGYNGGPRGGSPLCGGDHCLRDVYKIPSGTRLEVGCHHAEANAICNAAANGIKTQGAWILITGEPCLMCAKLIHHAGIVKVIVVVGGYTTSEGIEYLTKNGIDVEAVIE